MATSIDQLQIEIAAQDKASDVIESLASSIENLGLALEGLDATKVSSVARSISRITNSPQIQSVASAVSNIGSAAQVAESQVESLQRTLDGATFSRKAILGADANKGNYKITEFGFISDVEVVSAAKRLSREFSETLLDGFTTFDNTPLLENTTNTVEEKLLPAIIDTQNQVDILFRKMLSMSSVEPVYDAITGKIVEWKINLMEASGAIGGGRWASTASVPALPMFDKMLPAVIEVKDNFRELFEKDLGIDRTSQMIRGVGESLGYVQKKAEIVTEGFWDMNKSIQDVTRPVQDVTDFFNEAAKSVDEFARGVEKAKSEIEQAVEAARIFKQTISDMESGKIPFNEDDYRNAIKGYDDASKAIKDYKNAIIKSNDENKNALPSLVVMSEYLSKLSNRLGSAADKLMDVYPKLTKPLKLAAREYVEKCENIVNAVKNMQKKVDAHLTKMSAFWKRTMKTFTFMVIRKAITAIIKEVGTAVQSLAMFSNAMNTQFNKSLSTLVADFQYLGRSIVSVFAPILDAIAPIIDAITDKIAQLLSYIGMLISALTGVDTFTKAKKTVNNYAESLDKASKSAKNLTMGIDELNILNEGTSGKSNAYDGWEDAWENVDVPDSIKSLADKLKSIWDRITAPFEKAWDKAKEKVLVSWRAMTDSLKNLFASIGEAFLNVWNEDETVRVFELILDSIANIMLAIDNLADNFRIAWNEADRGVKIFEGIRDIIAILAEHFNNFTYDLFFWAGSIDFSPLLDSFAELLKALQKVADFIGGVFEDIMNNVILKHIEFLIEEGLPHLYETISEVIDAFDFSKIRKDLEPLEQAFERLLENIDKGKTNALGNLGKAIAEFTNGKEFTKFTQRIADIMDLISAKDVEKILTGIGKAILRVAESLVKFVNSDAFMAFLEAIDKWLENTSSDDIADILSGIAFAIGLFKFGQFATEGLSGFFHFLAILQSAKNLKTIADALSGTSGAMAGIGATIQKIGGIGLVISGLITSVTSFFKMWNDGWSIAGEVVKDIGIALAAVGAVMLGVAAAPAAIVAAVVAAVSTIIVIVHEHWDEICTFFSETIPEWWNNTALPWLEGIPSALAKFFSNMWKSIKTWASDRLKDIGNWLAAVGVTIRENVAGFLSDVVRFFSELPYNIGLALGNALATIVNWGKNVLDWVVAEIPVIINKIVTFFMELPGKIMTCLKNILINLGLWGRDVLKWIGENVSKMIKNIVDFFAKLPGEIYEWLTKILTKFNNWKDSTMSWIKTNVKAIVDGIVGYFKDLPSKIYKIGKNIVSNLIDGVKDAWDNLKSGFQDFVGGFLDGLSGSSGSISLSVGSVDGFASGGFPSYGSLFVAGEPGAGTEWVGNVGGRTGVVSNGEITGIEEAVYATGNSETQLLSQLVQVSRQILDKDPVVLGDRDVAMMSNKGQSKLGMNIIS